MKKKKLTQKHCGNGLQVTVTKYSEVPWLLEYFFEVDRVKKDIDIQEYYSDTFQSSGKFTSQNM